MKKSRKEAGFTLVELLTVIAIIAILAGFILGSAGYAARKADRSRAISDIEKIRNVLEEYRVQRGEYPDNPFSNITKAHFVGFSSAFSSKNDNQVGVLKDGYNLYHGDYNLDSDLRDDLTNVVMSIGGEIPSALDEPDPWGNYYVYHRTTKFQYELWSFGPDMLDKGDDISNRDGQY